MLFSTASPPLRTRLRAWSLGLGIAASFLFFEEDVGLNVPILGLLAGLAVLDATHTATRRVPRLVWALLAALVAVLVWVPIRANGFLTFLNVVLGAWLLHLAVARANVQGGAPPRATWLMTAPAAAALQALVSARHLLRRTEPRPARTKNLGPILRGLLIALPFLLFFGWLLASADWVFAQLLRDLIAFRIPPALVPMLGRLAVFTVAAWYGAGLLVQAAYPAPVPEATPERPLLRIAYVEALTALVVVAVLFGLFVWVQVTYLFGGSGALEALGFTYSEYARRGTTELAGVAAGTLALLLAARRFVRVETEAQARRLRIVQTVLALLVLAIVASALHRLGLYEARFGFTRTRLFARAAIGWLALLFGWLAFSPWLRRLHGVGIGTAALAALVGLVFTLNALNPDRRVARENLARHAAGASLDAHYLRVLSADAIPFLFDHRNEITGRDSVLLGRTFDAWRQRLDNRADRTGWPSFHGAYSRARRTLSNAPPP